jgi:hypothetical protein
MASITITGVDELNRKLGRVTANKTLKTPMGRAMNRIQRDMMKYPPPIAGSLYVRTDALKNRWGAPNAKKIEQVASGIVGHITNNLDYGPFVQSHLFQAGIHRGRWQTDADVLDKNKSAIVGDFRKAIEKALR